MESAAGRPAEHTRTFSNRPHRAIQSLQCSSGIPQGPSQSLFSFPRMSSWQHLLPAGMSNFPGLVYVVPLLYRIFFGRGREVGRELFPITWSVPSLPPGNNHENMRGPDQFRHLGNRTGLLLRSTFLQSPPNLRRHEPDGRRSSPAHGHRLHVVHHGSAFECSVGLRPSRSHIGASLRKSKSQAGRRGFGVR